MTKRRTALPAAPPLETMAARDLLRGGTPVVCLAHRSAFQQEADHLLALSAGDAARPVPRISIEIVPDTAAGEPAGTNASEKKDDLDG